MLDLPDVTLVCADTLNHALAVRAIARCCERIRYGRALFLTDALPAGIALPSGVEAREIAPLASREAYSTLMLKGLARHVESSHALVVQWDGYVVNPDAWTGEFLGCDYIGAPWPWGPVGSRVGNGGFSLRSRRLLDALADPHVVLQGNEDQTIGLHQRGWLEARHGLRFASETLASRFSFEVAYPVGRPFGFHGLFNFCRTVPEDEIAALTATFSDAIARSPQMLSLMRNCAALGQSRAALALASRILAAEARHPEAERVRADAERGIARGPVVGRNDPCPCGSGKRYKQCHGALGAGSGAAPPARDPAALVRAGAESHRAGRIDDAERAYREALALEPGNALADHYLGVIATHRGDLGEAMPRLERTVAAHPDEPEFHVHLGLAYAASDRFDDAIACYRRALALAPEHTGALNNLGLALQEQNRREEAADAYRRALAVDPDAHRIRWNLAMARLSLGDRGGWRDYEARLSVPELGGRAADPGVPRLDTLDVRGRTILVESEQGLGDTFQFARYASALATRGARVVVRAPPSVTGLLRTVPGVDEVVAPDARPRCDAWLPLASLPGLVDASPSGDPAAIPYLHADPALVSMVRGELGERRARLRAGLAWAGNPAHANDRRRSCPLAALAPLLARTDVDWYSLQRGDGEDQIAHVSAASRLHLLDARNDFDRKAALIENLDLVVSVDTSIAHLAGALGRPVWILLPCAADWRWGVAGAATGWYPTATLFRQRVVGDWTPVVADVMRALDDPPRKHSAR
jgi:tetratricopeptide (TPR) repeat protein